jgi:hypothetical protein
MRKFAPFFLAFLLLGCSIGSLFAKADEEKVRQFSSLEIILSDMSKKVIAHYDKQGKTVPPGFDEKQFIEVLEKIYPDKEKVERIRDGYRIKARPVDNNYSVVLCDRENGNKLLEDLSCTLNKVDVRYWDKNTPAECEFEADWKRFCK